MGTSGDLRAAAGLGNEGLALPCGRTSAARLPYVFTATLAAFTSRVPNGFLRDAAPIADRRQAAGRISINLSSCHSGPNGIYTCGRVAGRLAALGAGAVAEVGRQGVETVSTVFTKMPGLIGYAVAEVGSHSYPTILSNVDEVTCVCALLAVDITVGTCIFKNSTNLEDMRDWQW